MHMPETEKAKQFTINASEPCKAETEKSEVMYGQCTMQRAKTENAEMFMINAQNYAGSRDRESRTS